MRNMRGPATCAVVFLFCSHHLEAQHVRGRLREEGTRAPIAAALVILFDSAGSYRHTTFTDSLGLFSMTAVAGTYRIGIERIGYAAVNSEALQLAASDTTALELYLTPDAVRLEPIIVRDRPASRLDMFYERRRRFEKLGIGDFFGRDELDAWINQPVSAVLQSIPYLNAGSSNFGRLGSRSRRCQIGYYIDGVRLRSLFGQSIDDMVRVIDLEGIEVYRGQANLPAEYSDVQSRGCPVVALWTRRMR
jgi:hypothetical protein